MERKIITSLIFSMLALFQLSAQGTLKGIILGEDQPEGLIGANVSIGNSGTTTDYDGSFEMSIPAGDYTVNISYTGYDSYTESFSISDGETKEINTSLLLTTNLLQTATVTSGKFEKPLGEVTVSMEVIKPSFAQATNSNNVDDVLKRVPGVTMVEGQANIRGGSGFSYGAGSRVMLLVDDTPLLNGDSGTANWGDVPLENVEQIEVVKGAASALYGSAALNGIINVRTAYAKNEPETQFALWGETYTTTKDPARNWWKPDSIARPKNIGLTFVHRRKIKKFDWVFGVYADARDKFINGTDSNKFRVNNKLRYRFNENLSIGLFVNYNQGVSRNSFVWKNGLEGVYEANDQTLSRNVSNRYNIDPYLTYIDDKGNRHKYTGRINTSKNAADNDQGNFADLYYNEYQYQKLFENLNFTTTGGIVSTHARSKGELYGDTTFISNNIALYLQADKKFYLAKNADGSNNTSSNTLNISMGFRYEINMLRGPTTVDGVYINDGFERESKPVFRFGLNYQPKEFTYIRASWGQGYRYPTIAERYINTNVSGIPILPNPFLESETGWSTEMGLKQGLKIGGFMGYLDVSGFWSRYQNMMEFNVSTDSGFGFKSQNIGNTDIKGLEMTVLGSIPKTGNFPTTVLIGYTYINPKFREFEDIIEGDFQIEDLENLTEGQLNDYSSTADYNILKYRNKHNVKFDIETRYKKIAVGLSINGASRMEAIDEVLNSLYGIGTYRANDDNRFINVGARVAYNITDNLKLSVIGKNLLNDEYTTRPGIMEPPQSFILRIDGKF